MAIDTKDKRFSMLNFGSGVDDHILFDSDGTVDAPDQQHMLGCYSGIAFGAGAPPFTGPFSDSWGNQPPPLMSIPRREVIGY